MSKLILVKKKKNGMLIRKVKESMISNKIKWRKGFVPTQDLHSLGNVCSTIHVHTQ